MPAVGGFGRGDRITVGSGTAAETVTVDGVGTATTACTTAFADTVAGATTVPVTAVPSTLTVGSALLIGDERVTVTSLGTPGRATTLTAAVVAGATTITVAAATGIAAGDTLHLDTGNAREIRTVAAVNGTAVTLTTALAADHAATTAVRALGTGIGVTPALAGPHPAGEPVRTPDGTGIKLNRLTAAHPAGDPVANQATKKLVAVLAARCQTADCATQPAPVLLDRTTIKDLTKNVTADGRISWTAPTGDLPWTLLAYYQTADGSVLRGYQAGSPNLAVDHLSTAGAKVMTDFFDQRLLNPTVKKLIQDINRTGTSTFFEDSLELSGTLKWTGDFRREFEQRRGYPLTTALPAIAGTGRNATTTPPFDFGDGIGARIRTDYRNTWSDLYITKYLATYQNWANKFGSAMRAQTYGDPIDTGWASANIGVPENESIAANNNNEGPEENFRITATGAHLNGNTLVSSECCASFRARYGQKLEGPWGDADTIGTGVGTLAWAYQGYAAGVTQLIWHGWTYQNGPAAVWPGDHAWGPGGATGFNVGDAYGPRVPSWEDHRTVNDHLARIQLALRQGRPDMDVAVYYHDYGMKGTSNGVSTTGAQFAGDSALSRNGYLYEYLSPEFLRGKDATYRNGSLFASTSGYQALVLNNQATLPVDIARKLIGLAQAGMPIVFVGTLPDRTPGGKDTAREDAELKSLTARLLAMRTVRQAATEADLPAALAGLGIRPSVQRDKPEAAIQAIVRRTPTTDYYFLWNRTNSAVEQNLTLKGSGAPFLLDTWNGTISRLTRFTAAKQGVQLPVRLGANDATLIALSRTNLDGKPRPRNLVTGSTADSVVYQTDNTAAVRSATGGTVTTTLAGGRTVTTTVPAAEAQQTLGMWQLDVQSYEPGPNQAPLPQTPRNPVFTTVKTPVGPFTVTATDGKLPSWTAIPGLESKAGIGTYRTTVTLDRGWRQGQGAYLDLGSAVDTARVTVNGKALPPIDQSFKNNIDIGPYLRRGTNTIEVRVATPMFNRVGTARIEQGLFGPVTLRPYSQVPVASR